MKLKAIYTGLLGGYLSKPSRKTFPGIARGNKFLGIGKNKRIKGIKK